MLFMVQVAPDPVIANKDDAGEGRGPMFAKIAERFRPQSFYVNPTRRDGMMIVDLRRPRRWRS